MFFFIFSEMSREESSDVNNNTIEIIMKNGMEVINSKIEFGLSKFHSYFLAVKEVVEVIKKTVESVENKRRRAILH